MRITERREKRQFETSCFFFFLYLSRPTVWPSIINQKMLVVLPLYYHNHHYHQCNSSSSFLLMILLLFLFVFFCHFPFGSKELRLLKWQKLILNGLITILYKNNNNKNRKHAHTYYRHQVNLTNVNKVHLPMAFRYCCSMHLFSYDQT